MPLLLAGGILLVSPSCSREEMDIPSREETERVPVALSLSVAGMEAGTPETKAIMEPDIDNPTLEQQVKNIVVLQFEGTGNDAKLVALPKYYKDAASIFDETEQIRLLPSNTTNTIVVVANTFDNIYAQSGMTLGQFLQMDYSRLADYNAVLTRDPDGNDYIRMSGASTVESIGTDTPVAIELKRNVSKITIHVTNTSGTGDDTGGVPVKLKKAQLRDINAKYYYLTNIAFFQDNYTGTDPFRIDKEPEDLPEPNADGSYTLTYYVPANLRGTNGSTAQYSKPLGAPEGATRFCLYGTYGSSNTAINYTYYLGENLENDFNLRPNHHYTYNITIASKGDARYDYRIEDCKEVKFKVDANCYMVQPPMGQGQEQIYAIPIRRAAKFWNTKERDGIYEGSKYGNYSNYIITDGTSWTASVLWSDFNLGDYFDNPSDFLSVKTGKGYNPDKADQSPYFKIRVKSGMKGNVVIAVRYGDSGSLLWTWHIWITDYNPDREVLASTSGTYVYGVEGGNVHRYNNASFSANDKMFIMDRNLGASGVSYAGLNGTMYYQFGRKDPFVGYNQNGELNTYYTYGDTAQKTTGISLVKKTDTGSENVLYTISNPLAFITPETPEGWTQGSALIDPTKRWLDNRIDEHNELSVLEKNKSIYDPCPPGWSVPDIDAFDDIVQPKVSPSIDGVYYYPKDSDRSVAMYFPADGQRTVLGEMQATDRSLVGLWSATPAASDEAFRVIIYRSSAARDNGNCGKQAVAEPVRCMRDSEYVRENYIDD